MYEFLRPGTVLKRRYRIIKAIGGGGMGAVYMSEDIETPGQAAAGGAGLRVAVKEMRTDTEDPEEARQNLIFFEQEANMLRSLRHLNMPQVSDYFVEGGRHYLVMDLIPGESLEKKLDKLEGKPMDEAEAVGYAIQICEVLTYLHTQNPPIIFRDIKPANVMITPQGQAKLIDFGIARTYKGGKKHDTVAMGTAAYAPFEQFGKGETDARSDVYSLGATLAHLLTGKPPIPATTPTQASLKALNPKLSIGLLRLITKSMARKMEDRQQTTAELEAELRKVLGKPFVPPPAYIAPQPVISKPVEYPVVVPPSVQPTTQPPVQLPPYQPSSYQPPAAPVTQSPYAQPPRQPATLPPMPTANNQSRLPQSSPLNSVICPHCHHVNKQGARFCGSCGLLIGPAPSARLTILGGDGAVLWEQTLQANTTAFTIGRRSPSRNIYPDLDLTYMDPRAYISRRHAQVARQDNQYVLIDLGSENGTFVNERRVRPNTPYVLHNGDMVRVGKVQLRFNLAL